MTGTNRAENHNERQVSYFSGRTLPRMDPRSRAFTPYTARHVQAVVDAASINESDRVLDVGCGPGKYTLALAARGIDVQGMDLAPGLIRDLADIAPEIGGHVGDVMDPPEHLLGSFDVVTGFMMLHHVPDLDRALAGVAALLRPGGRVAFLEPNPYFPGYYVQITLTPGMSFKGDGGIVRVRPNKMRCAAEAAGFIDVALCRFGAFPPALANRRNGRRAEAWLERLPGWEGARAFQVYSMRLP